MIYLLFRQNLYFIYKVRTSFIMQRTFYTYSVYTFTQVSKLFLIGLHTSTNYILLTDFITLENIIHALPWTQRARAVRGIFSVTQKEIIHKCSGNSCIIIYQHVAQKKWCERLSEFIKTHLSRVCRVIAPMHNQSLQKSKTDPFPVVQ